MFRFFPRFVELRHPLESLEPAGRALGQEEWNSLTNISLNPRRLDVKKRCSEEQIIGFLREAEAGLPVKELCRKHGFSEASYYL